MRAFLVELGLAKSCGFGYKTIYAVGKLTLREGRVMDRWKRWAILAGVFLLGIPAAYVVFSFVFLDFIVDLWWFRSLGFEGYFWLRLLYRYIVFAAAVLFFFAVFFFNFWAASRFLGTRMPPKSGSGEAGRKSYRELVRMFRTGSMKAYTPLSAILAIPLALPLYREWEQALQFLFGPSFGATDPVFEKDIGFYLFSFPVFKLLQHRVLASFVLLLAALLALYWLEKRLLNRQAERLPRGAKIHLSVLVAFIFLIQAWGFFLERYALLYDQGHLPSFFGPGFTEMRVTLPLIWITLLFFLGTTFFLIVYLNTRKGFRPLLLFGAGLILALMLKSSDFLPGIVQQYIVKPNEISREKPFIENSIRATLSAYRLENVESRQFNVDPVPEDVSHPEFQKIIRNIPVWDGELLDDVYRQLQGIRPYYDFVGVDVDRYTVGGVLQQVNLSAREIDLEKLPQYARNWINIHLQYTHGYGMVMTPAAQGGDEFMTWFIQDIPPQSRYGFSIREPGIYFGLGDYSYVIVPNDQGELDYPKGDTEVSTNYRGTGGIPLTNMFRKALFSAYFKDRNIFFTTKTGKESRILLRRNIVEAIHRLTPFFLLDSDPYAVVTPEKLYWIQDAYTTSESFPNAAPFKGDANYIRNSVKIVIDAYDGRIDYYMADDRDPVIRAFGRMYPGLLRDMKQMPADLRSHIRYPKDLFEIQMEVYAKYHQTDPEIFYREEDIWQFAEVYRKEETVRMSPYYVTLNLIDRNRQEFILLSPMSPKARSNLRALAIVGCDDKNYGKIIVYTFPKGELVYGPSQINALIDQDTAIAEQLTLWGQVGSEVKRGNMALLPVGNTLLYIQPVYLTAAAGLKIPELKRLIVSQGNFVVMDASLEKAIHRLATEIKTKLEQKEKRFGFMEKPAEDKGQKTEDRGRKTVDGEQKTEGVKK